MPLLLVAAAAVGAAVGAAAAAVAAAARAAAAAVAAARAAAAAMAAGAAWPPKATETEVAQLGALRLVTNGRALRAKVQETRGTLASPLFEILY